MQYDLFNFEYINLSELYYNHLGLLVNWKEALCVRAPQNHHRQRVRMCLPKFRGEDVSTLIQESLYHDSLYLGKKTG